MTPDQETRLERLRAQRRARIDGFRLRPGRDHYVMGWTQNPERKSWDVVLGRPVETVRVSDVL
jgi:hypothetical protein